MTNKIERFNKMVEEQEEEEFWNNLIKKAKKQRENTYQLNYQRYYMINKTHIIITNKTNDRIKAIKEEGESANDVIVKLLILYQKRNQNSVS